MFSCASEYQQALQNAFAGEDISVFAYRELDSTNTEAKRLALGGGNAPAVIAAESQTAGRGRMGRSFYSPLQTGAYFSFLYQPSAGLDVAVADFDIYNTKHGRFEHNVESDKFELLDGGRVVSKSTHPDEILQCATGYVWNKMFRRDFLFENELSFNTSLKIFEDVHFVMTALSTATAVAKKPEVLVHHRVYSDQAKKKLFRKYYRQVPEIYARGRAFLMSHGMYKPLSQSFLNLSASRYYKIYNMLWRDAKEEFYNLYHNEYAEKLAWDTANASDFESKEVLDFVANTIMYTHKQYKKRDDRGRLVRIDRVGAYLRFKEKMDKFKAIFKKKPKDDII